MQTVVAYLFGTPRAKAAPQPGSRPISFRPRVEGLEDRVVMSAPAAMAAPVLAAPLAAPAAQSINILPIQINNVVNQAGQLVAQGVLGSTAFTAPLTLTTSPNAADPTCPILHLALGPIHLNVLGLTVDTSPICLDITAHEGGGVLGDLLCNVSNLLQGGTPLGDILGGLTSTQLSTLTTGVTGLLNGVFDQLTASGALAGVTGNILHLSLGPVDLNLLGLEVHLDNCNNGPVTIDIGTQPGAGHLLGNLLSGLNSLLHSHANNIAIGNKLGKIASAIGKLI